MFLTNYLNWAGHVARLPPERPLRQVISFRDVEWFRQEQRNPWRTFTHTHKKGNISRWENFLVRFIGPSWKIKARDRIEWEKATKHVLERLTGASLASTSGAPPTPNPCNPNLHCVEASAPLAAVPPRKRAAHDRQDPQAAQKRPRLSVPSATAKVHAPPHPAQNASGPEIAQKISVPSLRERQHAHLPSPYVSTVSTQNSSVPAKAAVHAKPQKPPANFSSPSVPTSSGREHASHSVSGLSSNHGRASSMSASVCGQASQKICRGHHGLTILTSDLDRPLSELGFAPRRPPARHGRRKLVSRGDHEESRGGSGSTAKAGGGSTEAGRSRLDSGTHGERNRRYQAGGGSRGSGTRHEQSSVRSRSRSASTASSDSSSSSTTSSEAIKAGHDP